MVAVSNSDRSFFSGSYECLAVIFDKLEMNISSKTKFKNKKNSYEIKRAHCPGASKLCSELQALNLINKMIKLMK